MMIYFHFQIPLMSDNMMQHILMLNSHQKNRAYMDLTGRFIYTSSRGNQYILVEYHFTINKFLFKHLKIYNLEQSSSHGTSQM